MNHIEVTVPYHQQDLARGCSAAVAQMVLQSMSQPVSQPDDLLRVIDNTCDQPGGIGCAAGVAAALNAGGGPATFADNEDDPDFATGCRRIAHSVTKARVAVPVIVQNGHHWVLVYGVDVDPSLGTDADATAFYFNDPEPRTASQVGTKKHRPPSPPFPPPHAAGDLCGTGVPAGHNGWWNFGMPATMATIQGTPNGWQTFWWSSSSGPPPPYVTVTADPGFDPTAAASAGRIAAPAAPPAPLPAPAPAPGLPPGGGVNPAKDGPMIGRDDAMLAAQRGIAAIPANAPVSRALQGAKPGDVVRVWRLDNPGDAYDLVTMTNAHAPVALATVDARTGTFLGVQAFPPESISTLIPLDAAWDIFEAHYRDREPGGECSKLRETERYVWCPGRASRSPYAPLVEITDHGGKKHYVARSGTVYPDVSERDPCLDVREDEV